MSNYDAILELNNIGADLLCHGFHEEAVDTFSNSLKAIKMICLTEESVDTEIIYKMERGMRLLSKPSPRSCDCMNCMELPLDCMDFEALSIVINCKCTDIAIRLTKIDCSDPSEEEVALVSAIILCNMAMAHLAGLNDDFSENFESIRNRHQRSQTLLTLAANILLDCDSESECDVDLLCPIIASIRAVIQFKLLQVSNTWSSTDSSETNFYQEYFNTSKLEAEQIMSRVRSCYGALVFLNNAGAA